MAAIIGRIRIAFLILLMQTSTGCVVHKLKTNRAEGKFKGIASYLQGDEDLTIFMTHGMGIWSTNYAEELNRNIATLTGFALKETNTFYNGTSALRLDRYTKNGRTLRVYQYSWFFATAMYRTALDLPDQVPERLPVMASFKSSMMNSAVSDVIMYQGNFRSLIKFDMRTALSKVLADNPRGQFVVVTESLGSKIFLDVMNDHLTAGSSWARDLSGRMVSLFMLSNQIPLLQMGDMNINNLSKELRQIDSDALASVTKSFKANANASSGENLFQALKQFTSLNQEKTSGRTQLVAISDPNDVLSYPVPPDAVNASQYELINVFVNVARTGFSRPFRKAEVVNPVKAHLGYQGDKRVVGYIVSGN